MTTALLHSFDHSIHHDDDDDGVSNCHRTVRRCVPVQFGVPHTVSTERSPPLQQTPYEDELHRDFLARITVGTHSLSLDHTRAVQCALSFCLLI